MCSYRRTGEPGGKCKSKRHKTYVRRGKVESRDVPSRGRRSRSSEEVCESRWSKGRKGQTAETKPYLDMSQEEGNGRVCSEITEPYEARVSRTVL